MTQIRDERAHIAEQGMYDSSFEHDNCGIGAVVNIKGIKTHKTVSDALRIVENLEHRAGKDAEGKTGDGVGILSLERNVIMVSVCSSSHRMSFSVSRQ